MDNVFGKILIVEDNFKTVELAIKNLLEDGLTIQYWNGEGDFPKDESYNVRVVVVDLDLTGENSRDMGPEYYFPAAEALNKIPGPFVAIVFAQDFDDEDPLNLKAYYEEKYDLLSGFFAEKGLSKDDELEDPGKLKKLIDSTIQGNKVLELILAWEEALDKAKDKGLGELVSKKIENTIIRLIKLTCKDLGKDSASREFIEIMTRIVSRWIFEREGFDKLTDTIWKLKDVNVATSASANKNDAILLYNKLMYYTPRSDEDVSTGDIYRIVGKTPYERYIIVLTPRCDLIQRKTKNALISFGFPLAKEFLKDPDFPPYSIDPKIIEKIGNNVSPTTIMKHLKARYWSCDQKLTDNFFIIWNFVDEESILGLCFDFNNVESIKIKTLKKFVRLSLRLSRLDIPFIQEIRSEYERFLSRVGTPDINKSPTKI